MRSFIHLQVFPLEVPIFLREYGSGLYGVGIYYMSKTLVEVKTFFICFCTLRGFELRLNLQDRASSTASLQRLLLYRMMWFYQNIIHALTNCIISASIPYHHSCHIHVHPLLDEWWVNLIEVFLSLFRAISIVLNFRHALPWVYYNTKLKLKIVSPQFVHVKTKHHCICIFL